MEPRERLTRIFAGKTIDRPPVLCPGGMMTVSAREIMASAGFSGHDAHCDPEKMAAIAERIAGISGFENVGVPFCMTVEAESFGARVDLGDIEREPAVTRYPCATLADFARLSPAAPEKHGRLPVLLEALRLLKKSTPHLPVMGNLVGPISLATSLVEPTIFFRAMRKETRTVHEILTFITDFLIRLGRAQFAAGADLVTVADPTSTGEILGPRFFNEFSKPYLEKLCQGLGRGEKPVIVHICGNVRLIAPAISDINSVAAFSFDSLVNVARLKEQMGSLVLMGNVSTSVLEKGSPELVRKIARICLARGVEILAPACGISPGTPLANIRALTGAVAGT
ncbi:Methylcobalamin methyltransferase MMP0831 [hydrothermal vent metagenome]|uniref:Methylcobalamin methyltransferase MMP0831 n=1 Tax=hydrothermal vent metagenome TaxID=652676 RepID=A0A3B0VLA2_9ZZZZ